MREEMKAMGMNGNPGDLSGMLSKLMGGGQQGGDSDDEDAEQEVVEKKVAVKPSHKKSRGH
jgi:hypothetical protein